jgi:hypothetical protein
MPDRRGWAGEQRTKKVNPAESYFNRLRRAEYASITGLAAAISISTQTKWRGAKINVANPTGCISAV